jgi:hypothetical protein
MSKYSSNQIITVFEKWYKKAPKLDNNVKNLIINYIPWVAIIFGLIGVILSVPELGVITIVSPFAAIGGINGISWFGLHFILTLIILIASVLLLAAYPGTKARKINGWKLFFWSEFVQAFYSLITLSLLGLIIAGFIFYLLFQVKSHYS